MKITTTEKYSLFKAENNFNTLKSNLSSAFNDIKEQNIVLDLSEINTTEEEVNSLITYAEAQIENNLSFVIILKSFNADAFKEELNIVPTLIEAEDIIDMDEMTRDLGF